MAVTVYTTPTCPWCKQAKALLESKGVPYLEVDVTKDRRLVEELQGISGQLGVPVTTDGATVVVGFNKARLERLAGDATPA